MPSAKTPKLTERALQQQVKRLFTLAGCIVYDTSQGYRPQPGGTRMTPGLADLIIFFPLPLGGVGFFEVKTPDGLTLHRRQHARGEKRAQGQAAFATRCQERRIPYAMGGMQEAQGVLASLGCAFLAQGRGLPVRTDATRIQCAAP